MTSDTPVMISINGVVATITLQRPGLTVAVGCTGTVVARELPESTD